MYRLVLADTPELIDTAYRVRHRAYCQRAGFERVDLAEMEIDGHDRRSVHVLVFWQSWPLAAARLILPPEIPIRHHCPDLVIEAEAAEVSRFSIPQPSHRAVFDVVEVIRLLGQGIWDVGQRHGVAAYYLLMKPALRRLLARAGLICEVVGNPVDLHGLRWPTRFKGMSPAGIAGRGAGGRQPTEPRDSTAHGTNWPFGAVPAPLTEAGENIVENG